jgi:hypothetical protein
MDCKLCEHIELENAGPKWKNGLCRTHQIFIPHYEYQECLSCHQTKVISYVSFMGMPACEACADQFRENHTKEAFQKN